MTFSLRFNSKSYTVPNVILLSKIVLVMVGSKGCCIEMNVPIQSERLASFEHLEDLLPMPFPHRLRFQIIDQGV